MFNKILIANRGEIACRVIKTARLLGIKTVAVYSQEDQTALHVKLADEAVLIGSAAPASSYLCGEKIIAAAQQTGAQAVHPGYGFLSENAEFCQACENANIVFIGPPVAAIKAMGSKSAAKIIMAEAGVPLVPGYHGDDQSAPVLKQAADEIGYPVLLKAVAGGGGKGMRQVSNAGEFDDALGAAKREALAGFSNDDMLVEKYLTQPRHVEVQVFCDQHGGGVYLFERDCSIQRRHQKVIEEAPAPGMSNALRVQMGQAALDAAKAIHYVGAGTVEFLLDADGSFFFMEMNTRLQVEHPVTEMITAQDLVEWQLKVAAGERLPCQQSELAIQGHSFEARVYAEDPENDFLPSTGVVSYLQAPAESDNVRVDMGVESGGLVSVYYDPMIAKLVVWDEDRDRALNRLVDALRDFHLVGVKTNIDFLIALADSQPFRAAELDTGFIETHQQRLFCASGKPSDEHIFLIALAQLLHRDRCFYSAQRAQSQNSIWSVADGWRVNSEATQIEQFTFNEREYAVPIQRLGDQYLMSHNDSRGCASAKLDGTQLTVNIDGHHQQVTLVGNASQFTLFTAETRLDFSPLQPDLGESVVAQASGFRAPMNGTVVAVLVAVGEQVAEGDGLVIIEAMKMEHSIRASQAGTVTEIYFSAGDRVDGGAELLSFEASPQAP